MNKPKSLVNNKKTSMKVCETMTRKEKVKEIRNTQDLILVEF